MDTSWPVSGGQQLLFSVKYAAAYIELQICVIIQCYKYKKAFISAIT